MTNTEVKIQKAMAERDKIRKEKKALWFKADDILSAEEVTKGDKVFKYVMVSIPDSNGVRRVAFVTDNGKAVYKLTSGGRLFATKDYLLDYLDFHSEMYQEIIDWYNDILLPSISFLKQQQEEEVNKEESNDEDSIELEESDVDVEKEDYVNKLVDRFAKFNGIGEKRANTLAKYVAENRSNVSSVEDLKEVDGVGDKTIEPMKNVNIKNLIA